MNAPAFLEHFDVLVVGSGATGGLAARVLCEAGIQVGVIEAGSDLRNTELVGATADLDSSSPGSSKIQRACFAFNHHTQRYFVNDLENPYCTPDDQPFWWIRTRSVGGKMVLWAGQSYRMSDLDFRAGATDGWGEVWPIGYADLDPYYSRSESLLNVRGTSEAIPELPDGLFCQAEELDANAKWLQTVIAKNGRRLIPARISVDVETSSTTTPCIHCGRSNQGCLVPASARSLGIEPAAQTGLLKLITNSIVKQLITDSCGNAIGVKTVDRVSREECSYHASVIFLCASALESTRILLNSRSLHHPNGFANSSGTLGHYLMDHVSGATVTGIFRKRHAGDAKSARPVQLLYIPASRSPDASSDAPYIRGYGIQVTVLDCARYDENISSLCGLKNPTPSARMMSSGLDGMMLVRLQPFGEMLPYYDNYVEIDKNGNVDAWGIPTLYIRCKHRDNELAMVNDMRITTRRLLQSSGISILAEDRSPQPPGLSIHEMGTCRMGTDPTRSVLNSTNQCHDAPNVFVTDGSCFPSGGSQNPTLTMMALTIRAAEHAATLIKNRKQC